MLQFLTRVLVAFSLCSAMLTNAYAQPSLSSDLKKPKKFENKQLGSEKTAEKKFTLPRRFVQNTVTHYNWYYNANNRLAEVAASSYFSIYVLICQMKDSFLLGGVVRIFFGRLLFSLVEIEKPDPSSVVLLPMVLSYPSFSFGEKIWTGISGQNLFASDSQL